MPQEFKYPLTRICLRSGRLTLPMRMMELFPESGTVTATDTKGGETFELTIDGPRFVAGLENFFRSHQLEVNDAVLIRPLDDGGFAFTPQPRPRKPDFSKREVVEALLEEIVTAATPMTVAEIRALHPDMPADFDLAGALTEDGRLELVEGRWRVFEPEPEPEEAPVEEEVADDLQAEGVAVGVEVAPDDTAADAHSAEAGAEPVLTEEALPEPEEPASDPPEPTVPRRVTVTPYPRGVMFPGDAALNSAQEPGVLTQVQRTREILTRLGYRIESLGHGQLMAHAELGRYQYRVLVHILPEGERLDWAALLAERRETGAKYLAVFGDYRDLRRLFAPADLARATLWSWDGLTRVEDLARTVLISPTDLEPHFDQDGMFERGLSRFEQSVGERIAERGVFSAVLSRLASMRAPTIFVLDDLSGEIELPRDQLARLVERLTEAPFQLVVKVGNGEYCLRNQVGQALLNFSEYALSLRDRLPTRTRERVIGLAEPGPVAVMEVVEEEEGAEEEEKE